jgi:hypothetical protein
MGDRIDELEKRYATYTSLSTSRSMNEMMAPQEDHPKVDVRRG